MDTMWISLLSAIVSYVLPKGGGEDLWTSQGGLLEAASSELSRFLQILKKA